MLIRGLLVFLLLSGTEIYVGPALAKTPTSASSSTSQTTASRLRRLAWWPTSTAPERQQYTGSQACATCHRSLAATQSTSRMARASALPSASPEFQANPRLQLKQPGILTTITASPHGAEYAVETGGHAKSGKLLWSMGAGKMGQTFIVESGNNLYEGQLSYFTALRGLDLTPGHESAAGTSDVDLAFGTLQTSDIAQRCFACHTTASSSRGRLDTRHAMPGVGCEACHGPGARHVESMTQQRPQQFEQTIFNPADLDAVGLVDFCGACHRSSADIRADSPQSAINVRFQPYRLAKSRCWSKPDDRLTCVACHDPHAPLVEDIAAYDGKCLACHADAKSPRGAGVTAQTCTVASARCVSCHMPRYVVPQMHGAFTDHYIRIVRPGEKFPL